MSVRHTGTGRLIAGSFSFLLFFFGVSAAFDGRSAAAGAFFVYSGNQVSHSHNPALTVRVGERLPVATLKLRFSRYAVVATAGEDCAICANIKGADGSFSVNYDEAGLTVVSIVSADRTSADALGNRVGIPLIHAVGPVAECDAGMDLTCRSNVLSAVRYIVEMESDCKFNTQQGARVPIPKCARIGGFLISN